MPQAAWLAVGAAFGALALSTAGALPVALGGTALVCLAVAVAASPWRRHARVALPLAVGVLAIGLRAGLGQQLTSHGLPHRRAIVRQRLRGAAPLVQLRQRQRGEHAIAPA